MSILQEQTIEQHLTLYLMILTSEQSQLSQYSLKLRQHILHNQTFTDITQKSIAGTSATGAEFTVVTDNNGTITTVTVTNGGTAYNIGDDITISGADLGGTDGTHDVVLDMATMSFPDVVSTATLLDASIDTVTVTNGGSGYLSAPTITAQGGNGINAD